MLKIRYPLLASLLLLLACDTRKTPNEANLRGAINQYLQVHGQACTSIGQPFPVDITESQQPRFGVASRMAALERVGLVQSTNTETAARDAPQIFGGTLQRRVRRYLPTATGRNYLKKVQTSSILPAEFCYGTKAVDTIITWTAPVAVGGATQTQVAYTYKISDLASWAQNPDIQEQFNDIRTTINGTSKTSELAGLQLTNKGWEVPVR